MVQHGGSRQLAKSQAAKANAAGWTPPLIMGAAPYDNASPPKATSPLKLFKGTGEEIWAPAKFVANIEWHEGGLFTANHEKSAMPTPTSIQLSAYRLKATWEVQRAAKQKPGGPKKRP